MPRPCWVLPVPAKPLPWLISLPGAIRPTLILEPQQNAGQPSSAPRCGSFFPDDAVEYFVSYYDYYQPEAYIPSTDTYIEKDASINDEIDRLRHSATAALLRAARRHRRCQSFPASTALGDPIDYCKHGHLPAPGHGRWSATSCCSRLVDMQYRAQRHELYRATRSASGATRWRSSRLHTSEHAIRVEFFGDEIDRIIGDRPPDRRGEAACWAMSLSFPASHYVVAEEKMNAGHCQISRRSWRSSVAYFKSEGKLLEAQRIAAAHQLRYRDAAGDRLLLGHRKLFAAI